jgi:hypothetical protein
MQAFHLELEAPGPSPSDGMKTSVPEKFASTVPADRRTITAAIMIFLLANTFTRHLLRSTESPQRD